MCRSVMVKGIEALLLESLLAARHYGVEEAVLDSLQTCFPADDWRDAGALHDLPLARSTDGAAPRRCAKPRARSPKRASSRT